MADTPAADEIEARIAVVRENIRELIEQAAAVSGAGAEDAMADRIAEQEAELIRLNAELDQARKA